MPTSEALNGMYVHLFLSVVFGNTCRFKCSYKISHKITNYFDTVPKTVTLRIMTLTSVP